jgi:hypothetical protein
MEYVTGTKDYLFLLGHVSNSFIVLHFFETTNPTLTPLSGTNDLQEITNVDYTTDDLDCIPLALYAYESAGALAVTYIYTSSFSTVPGDIIAVYFADFYTTKTSAIIAQ